MFREKSIHDLVAAWPAVAKLVGEAQLVIVGDGPLDDETASPVALETMATGLPVAATRVGRLPEYVADGVTGRIVGRADRLPIA